MPFTPSHPAAVLPFLGAPLPAAPLVLGAMAPDLVFFVPFAPSRAVSHSLLGAVALDPAIAVAALLAWWMLLRAPLLDLGPSGLRRRMDPRPGRPAGGPLRVIVPVLAAILVGIGTHIAWDWFTHPEGLASVWAPWRVRIGPLLLTSWLQYLSSAVGAAITIGWIARWWRRTPARGAVRRRAPEAGVRAAVVSLVGLAALVAAVVAGSGVAGVVRGGGRSLLFRVVVYPIAADFAAVIVISVVWWVAAARGTRGARQRPERIRS